MSSEDKIASGAYKRARAAFMRMEAGARALGLLRGRELTHGRLCSNSEHMPVSGKWPVATHLGPSRISFPLSALTNVVGDLQGSRALAFWRTQLFLMQSAGSSKLKAFDSKPCPDVQCRIPVTKQNMKLSAGTGSKLSSLMCRTVTFYDSGGGQPKHMERTFLQIRDTQRERLDKGKGKEGKVSCSPYS